MTAIHTTVAGLMTSIQNEEHKLYMDNFFLLTYVKIYILTP
jgi:hypothetical protein